MTFQEIQELIKLVGRAKLNEFKLKNGDFELLIRSESFSKGKQQIIQQAPQPVHAAPPAPPQPAPAPAAAPVADLKPTPAAAPKNADKYIEIKSPMIGTFYRSSSPEKPAFVQVGDTVSKDSVVCIIEAMKLFNEIEAELSGTIVKVLVEDASPVQYDQPLFLIDPTG